MVDNLSNSKTMTRRALIDLQKSEALDPKKIHLYHAF
jgi:hypothetical protein